MVSAIVCVDENNAIGKNGDLLISIPGDMQFFKDITQNTIVIMGRKTYNSLRVKPLPNRYNVIISRDDCIEIGKNTLKTNMEMVKAFLNKNIKGMYFDESYDVYIIGGGYIYKELLPYCDRIFLTKVYNSYEGTDTFFPKLNDEWLEVASSNIREYKGVKYQYFTYDRVKDSEIPYKDIINTINVTI